MKTPDPGNQAFNPEPTPPCQVEKSAGRGNYAQCLQQGYHQRIETLRTDAEIEGFVINAGSESNFWSFIQSVPHARKAELVLMDNGNFRAVWKDKNGDHLGVLFLGEQMAEYVIFKHRPAAGSASQVAGIDTLEGVITQLHAFDPDLEPLAAA